MRTLFVGGPGRSGTSFVADRLGAHPNVVTLQDIELKIFCEKNGLLDLFHSLAETYSPNRAVMALDQFRRMAAALIEGRYGQPALTTAAPAEDWHACFAAFTCSLLEDGHPAPQTAERFFEAARALLHRIAALAARAGAADSRSVVRREIQVGNTVDNPGDNSGSNSEGNSAGNPVDNPVDNAGDNSAEETLFLEKTPHNLLAIGFLARLAPGARFLHVMRDPRSIAWSLLAMRWGPDELATAARWVDSYCRAWTAAEARAAGLGLPLIRLYIEDAAAAPAAAGAWLTAQLGLRPVDGLFRDADPEMLSRWAAKADPAERALLDARLMGWVAHFGYDPGQVGRRTDPSSTLVPAPGRSAGPEAA